MKNSKLIIGIFIILAGISEIIRDSLTSGLLTVILGILILPPISNFLLIKVKLWQMKNIRYTTYVLILLCIGMSIKSSKSKTSAITKKNDRINKVQTYKHIKTCNYGGEEMAYIPNLAAADIYTNFEKLGFKVDKQIKNDYTSILCTLSKQNVKYTVDIEGCSPDELVEITALALDYSGDLKEVTEFFGYVATLQYEGSKPEKARQWVRENIDKDGAETIFGQVKFKINFRTRNSKILTLQSTK